MGGVGCPRRRPRSGGGTGITGRWCGSMRSTSERCPFGSASISGLTQPGLSAAGNLLVVTLPAVTAFRTEEFRPLDAWVRAGNTLLVLAALADDPDWAFSAGRPASGDLTLLTGLEFETVRGSEQRGSRPAKPRATDDVGGAYRGYREGVRAAAAWYLVPNGSQRYFDGVRTAVALSDYPWQTWAVKIPYDGFVLSLAHERETGESVMWTRSLGNGRIIVSGLGSLFTNRALGLADNARLLANIVGATVGPKGAVLFDDMHQGLGAAYDPAKFYSDRRLYETIGILAALWLCWVLGATKLQLPGLRAPAPREAELVQATGGFLARVLTPAAGALGLFEHFFRRVRERLPTGGWARRRLIRRGSFSRGIPGVTAVELRQLKGWYADARAARRVPLGRLHNLIQKIDRTITA